MDHKTFNIKDCPDATLRGGNNRYLTEGLFVEYQNPDAVYTLKTEDYTKNGKTYISMYRVYMQCADEYEAAERLLGSQEHWRKLLSSRFFLHGIERFNGNYGLLKWREDMQKRDESLAKRTLIQQANEGNVNAAKALQGTQKKAKPKEPEQSKSKDDDIFSGFAKANEGAKHVQ